MLTSTIKNFIFILLSAFSLNVNAIVNSTSEFYVNDYANILSNETEDYILEKSVSLYNYNGAQIVVVTIPNLDGMTIENYATTLFNNWGIGDKDKNNGLLLLLSLEDRQFRVEVGSGIEGILPDGKTSRYQETYLIPYLKDNKWDEGIKSLYNAFYDELSEIENLEEYENNEEDAIVFGLIIYFILIIFLIIILSKRGRRNIITRGIMMGSSLRSSGSFSSGNGRYSSGSRYTGGGGHSSGGGSSRSF